MSGVLALTPIAPWCMQPSAHLPCGCGVKIIVTLEITDAFLESDNRRTTFEPSRYFIDKQRNEEHSLALLMTDTRVCIDAINALLEIMGWNKGPEIFIQGALPLGPHAVTHMSPIYIVLQSLMYWIFSLRGVDIIPIGLTSLEYPYKIDGELDMTVYSKHRLCGIGRVAWPYDLDAPPFHYCGGSPGAGVRNVFPDVMRILLPKFNEMHVRIQTLTEAYPIDDAPELAFEGADTLSNVMLCLDVAESLAKIVPGFGALAEGICGTVRKIISMTQSARAVKEDCVSLVQHTATIALAVVTQVNSSAGPIVIDSNLLELWSTVQDVERGVAALSKLPRYKYFLHRARISQEISELRTRLDNSRMAFRIRSDLSTRQLLMDIQHLQRRLVARVEEVHSTQRIYHRETNEKLDFLVRVHTSAAMS